MGISAQSREIESLVNDIRDGRLLLPELQRSYVWDSTQVRNLFDSLYHQYPSGQILVWETDDLPFARAPGVSGVSLDARRPQLLLDGQQRLTSLAAVMLGRPLKVKWRERPIDIAFNVYTEACEVVGPRQRGQQGWISLTKLFTQGELATFADLKLDISSPEAQLVLNRLKSVAQIKHYVYRVDVLENLTYDEVTDIFVRVNSGGTKLGHADLALAQLSSRWRGVTETLDGYRVRLKERGWDLDMRILLRAMTTLLTSQAYLSKLFSTGRQKLTIQEFQSAWTRTEPAMDQATNFIVHNCSIDQPSLMPTSNVLIPLVAFFDRHGRDVTAQQARQLQRWLYMALIWSRYSSTVESKLDQDITALGKSDPISNMIGNIEDQVGTRRAVTEREFRDQLYNSPHMLMAYVLAKRAHAQDWFNGVAIGSGQILEFHHIFPRAILKQRYDLRQDSRVVNQVANLVFVSEKANARIAASDPSIYLAKVDETRLRAQYVPLDRSLWTLDRYEDFVHERRRLLADAINQLLQSLVDGATIWPINEAAMLENRLGMLERQLRELIVARLSESFGALAWEHGLPPELQRTLQGRIDARVQNNPFEAGQYAALDTRLEHCMMSDYPKIIRRNWDLFQDVFGDVAQFEQCVGAAINVRNGLKHDRDLNSSERAFGEGGLLWLEECLKRVPRNEADEEDEEGNEEEPELNSVTT
jgi:hypothetical protein